MMIAACGCAGKWLEVKQFSSRGHRIASVGCSTCCVGLRLVTEAVTRAPEIKLTNLIHRSGRPIAVLSVDPDQSIRVVHFIAGPRVTVSVIKNVQKERSLTLRWVEWSDDRMIG
eukprot:9498730-Pyramimonas_sp.AAC.2